MTGLSSLSPHRLLSLSCSLVRGETAVLWFPWLSLALLEMEREKISFLQARPELAVNYKWKTCPVLSPPVSSSRQ